MLVATTGSGAAVMAATDKSASEVAVAVAVVVLFPATGSALAAETLAVLVIGPATVVVAVMFTVALPKRLSGPKSQLTVPPA